MWSDGWGLFVIRVALGGNLRGDLTPAGTYLRPTKHGCGSAEFVPDGRRSAQAAAPRHVWLESTANCRSNRPRGDLRRAKVDDFGMSEELTALRAVALPAAARGGAGRLATSFLMTPACGTRSQTAIPRRANAAVPALKNSKRVRR